MTQEDDQPNKELNEQSQPTQATTEGVTEPKSVQAKPYIFPWGVLAKTLAVIGSVGGLALHMMGFLSYRTYFTEWGIDPGLFPHSTDAIIINGFYVLADRTVAIFSATSQNKYLAVAAGLTVYIFLIFRMGTLGKYLRSPWRPPEWLTDLAKSALMTSVMMGVVPFAVVVSVIVLITPADLGERTGRSQAKEEMKRYIAGCNQKDAKDKCIEIRREGETVAHGFLIESSESHIALFDVDKKQARALEREGTELLVDKPSEIVDSGK